MIFFGSPKILACSPSLSKEHRDLMSPRTLCSDRQEFFAHMAPRRFTKNVVKICVVQYSTVMTNYWNDQLKEDLEREERVQSGELTRQDATRESNEWQEREWTRRIDGIQHRILIAFAKYHAVMFLMRSYEKIAEKQVSQDQLDKLTKDPFQAAKRSEGSETIFRDMLATCWNANIIYYLADYSVHQIILLYGYYAYIQHRRNKIKADATSQPIHSGSVALSFLKKSTLLAFSRGVGCMSSAFGGALGSMVWPGWGTLCGVNLGDSLSYQLGDDVTVPSLD